MNNNNNPFHFLEGFDVAEVAQILSNELPFVSGAALSRMSPVFNAKVMANMPDKIRNEVASAITKYRQIPTEVMFDIAEELEKKLNSPAQQVLHEQKSSLLANLDLGAISSAINNLKVDKNPTHAKPEPVESRIIKPEEYEEYLRKEMGDSAPTPTPRQESIDPDNFHPNKQKPHQEPTQPRNPRIEQPSQPDLTAETKREIALQEALMHTRSKRHETKITPKQPQSAPPKRQTSYKSQKIDGMALAAHILRESAPELRNMVMNEVPDLYQKLNGRMFDFADLERSDRKTLGKIFSGLDPKTSALALRFASDTLKNTALTAVSRRKATLIIDEFKNSSQDKVRITAIEDAQQEAIDYAVELQNRGEIIIDPNDSGIV